MTSPEMSSGDPDLPEALGVGLRYYLHQRERLSRREELHDLITLANKTKLSRWLGGELVAVTLIEVTGDYPELRIIKGDLALRVFDDLVLHLIHRQASPEKPVKNNKQWQDLARYVAEWQSDFRESEGLPLEMPPIAENIYTRVATEAGFYRQLMHYASLAKGLLAVANKPGIDREKSGQDDNLGAEATLRYLRVAGRTILLDVDDDYLVSQSDSLYRLMVVEGKDDEANAKLSVMLTLPGGPLSEKVLAPARSWLESYTALEERQIKKVLNQLEEMAVAVITDDLWFFVEVNKNYGLIEAPPRYRLIKFLKIQAAPLLESVVREYPPGKAYLQMKGVSRLVERAMAEWRGHAG
jgi:hypothetical protein